MRTVHEAIGGVETYSPAEERFNRRRRTWGLALAPTVFALIWVLPLPALSVPAHRLAAILAMVVVLWICESLPMAMTAVLGPVLAIVMGVAPARETLAPFADPIIFLFIGSFMLAEAMFVHKVDRRIAFTALSSRFVGTSAARMLVVYGGVAAVLSMWMSNTATTAMLFPIGLAIVSHVARTAPRPAGASVGRFALAMMLMTAFGASVGGLATPVGTPPNLIGIGLIDRLHGLHIGFFQWMAVGLPVAALLFGFLALYFYLTCVRGRGLTIGEDSAALVRQELTRLGPMSRGQRNVLIAFGATVVLWMIPGLFAITGQGSADFARAYAAAVPEGVAAMLGALLLFVLPVNWRARRFTLSWDEAVRIDWGIVLLYGGGLALGELAFSTGLAETLGQTLTGWLPSHTAVTLAVLFAATAILLSETTSNTASANMLVPIAIAVAQATGVDPVLPAVAATLGASLGFMMPISTPPNAIVYSSGYVPITAMMRYGLALDLVGFILIVGLVLALAPFVLP
ncbi:MAG: DASS family sodium-coupled anion symporter [Luteitalea sp.]|nr:DASS family sodium-coupled anion symporter [Luteitalea sp.]